MITRSIMENTPSDGKTGNSGGSVDPPHKHGNNKPSEVMDPVTGEKRAATFADILGPWLPKSYPDPVGGKKPDG